MKKLKFEDIKKGDWIFWDDCSADNPHCFISIIKEIEIEKENLIEEWWETNNILNKFDEITEYRDNQIFGISGFDGYEIIQKMTEKQIEDFKNKLTLSKI